MCLNPEVDSNSGVSELRLNSVGLRGEIPDIVFDLPSLRALSFSHNPANLLLDRIDKAKNLEVLLMSDTEVRSLAGLENAPGRLTELHVGLNQLNGTFPSSLFALSSLSILDIHGNLLSSTLPGRISEMKSLRELKAWDNNLEGPLPTEIGLLTNLMYLELQQNFFSGALPTELESLVSLEHLDLSAQLSDSKFAGPLLAFNKSATIQSLILRSNSLAGSIPQTFLSAADRTSAILVDLADNELSGGIPEALDSFYSLDLRLEKNLISTRADSFCDNTLWMGNLTGLFGCDSILCPPGTFAPDGRQTGTDTPCTACPTSSSSQYYGSVDCSADLSDQRSGKCS
jgi:Leucine rich repeat